MGCFYELPVTNAQLLILVFQEFPVGVGVHQFLDLGGVIGADLDHPAIVIRRGVDDLGRVGKFFVDFLDDAADGRVDIGDGLDRFHHSESLAGGNLGADLGQFNENDVPQRFLGMVGDANGTDIIFDQNPFMIFGVFQLLGKIHVPLLFVSLVGN